jgi:hypothetical protein
MGGTHATTHELLAQVPLFSYKINLKPEPEVAELQRRVDQIYEAMQAHFAKLEKDGTR